MGNFSLLSAVEGQRPRNYLSCCCSWIFHLIYALSTSTTVQPQNFPYISLPLSHSFLTPLPLSSSLSTLPPSHFSLSLSFPFLCITQSLYIYPSLFLSLPPSLSHSSLMHYQLPPPGYPQIVYLLPFYIFKFIISLSLSLLHLPTSLLPPYSQSLNINM